MSDADEAYKAAERQIAEVRERGDTKLDFDSAAFRALDRLPPGIGTLDRLEALDLQQTQVADIALLQGLENLQLLFLDGTRVADVTPLQGLVNLKRLGLSDTQVADITHLKDLENLLWLDLGGIQVADINPLKGLENLQALGLTETQVADITPLKDLGNLQSLFLGATEIADIAPLKCLGNLQALHLTALQVADITPLHGLVNLQRLVLTLTRVTDIAALTDLDNLRWLDLERTRVADLRPIADLPRLGDNQPGGLHFAGTPAASATPELTRLSQIEDDAQRTRETQAYLKTLPPWPEPLPWAETPATASPSPQPATGSPAHAAPGGPPPHGLPRRITAGRARKVLETHSADLREQCQFVTGQINDTLAQQIPAKPNDPEQLEAWTHLVNTLELARAAITSLQGAVPEQTNDRPVTQDEANRLTQAFETAIATLQKASAYIDGPAEAHGRTYAGLLKIGVCSALAAPIALISAQPAAVVGGGLYAMLYGKGAALDVVKAIGAVASPESDTSS